MPELENPRWERFAKEYVKDLNGSAAYLRAGYNTVSPDTSASSLLGNSIVAARISELQMEVSERLGYDFEYVLTMINQTGLRCMQKVPVLDWDYVAKKFIQKKDEEGNDLWTFDSHGALKAWELLGRHIGLFEKDNRQRAPVINVAILNATEQPSD